MYVRGGKVPPKLLKGICSTPNQLLGWHYEQIQIVISTPQRLHRCVPPTLASGPKCLARRRQKSAESSTDTEGHRMWRVPALKTIFVASRTADTAGGAGSCSDLQRRAFIIGTSPRSRAHECRMCSRRTRRRPNSRRRFSHVYRGAQSACPV